MDFNENNRPDEARMQALISRFARVRYAGNESPGPHPDEDSLAAFVDGALGEREGRPVVAHLADCSFCRRITAELVRLDLATDEGPAPVVTAAAEPSRISEVLGNVLSRIFGSTEGVVFAHQAPEEEEPAESAAPDDPHDQRRQDS